MNAEPERHVPVVPTGDVEAVGIDKLRGIAVSGTDRRHYHGALPDRVAIDLDVFARDARGALDGAVVAQELLDRARGERRISLQSPELVGMAQERQHPVADEVHRRLVTGHEEEDAHGQEFALRQPIALLLGRDERAQQIRSWLTASLGYLAAEVLGQRIPRLCAALLDLDIGVRANGIQTASQV